MDEFTDDELREAGLNPQPTCWSDSGITPVERAAMRLTAMQYPLGAYAAFVRDMDEGEARKRAITD